MLVLIRNPRRAIPSYHTMRWELDYSKTWQQSYLRIPDTYTERPTAKQWEMWREVHFHWQIEAWVWFYDFWMQAGFMDQINMTHFRCTFSEIDCQPQNLIDFDNLYTPNPTPEFEKIGEVLDAANNVEVIAPQARQCVLSSVYNRVGNEDLNMHQANRPYPDLPMEYKFTVMQMDKMINRTMALRDKYMEEPLASKPFAPDLVNILNVYIDENLEEQKGNVNSLLDDFIFDQFGENDCNFLFGNEKSVCEFMQNQDNHHIFASNEYPDRFPYKFWLQERFVLVGMFLNNGGDSWRYRGGWLSGEDHCNWEGVVCGGEGTWRRWRVVEINLPGNQVTGTFPDNLQLITELNVLNLSSNTLEGNMPNSLCAKSVAHNLYVTGDARNCPNPFNGDTGEYYDGCCDEILIDVDIYLKKFAQYVLGRDTCGRLGGTEISVCEFMVDKNNHPIFKLGYPASFEGNVYQWLKERAGLVRLYWNQNGAGWRTKEGWLGTESHCAWYGVTCDAHQKVVQLSLQNNQLAGRLPDFKVYDTLTTLSIGGNMLTGTFPGFMCDASKAGNLYIFGDGRNCPNEFNSETGEYFGCCNAILIDTNLYLNEFLFAQFGTNNCGSLAGPEATACSYMANKRNHNIFDNGYPLSFEGNVWKWLKERLTLVEMHLGNGGSNWRRQTGWLGNSDHCTWSSVTCTDEKEVKMLSLQNNLMTGIFPEGLDTLEKFNVLSIASNDLTGLVPEPLCTKSTENSLYVFAEAGNCPNEFNGNTGQYLAGCCDSVFIDVGIYLTEFAKHILGDENCVLGDDTEIAVCNYMTEMNNHELLYAGYPLSFVGNVWSWLKERSTLVRLYTNTTGADWTSSDEWTKPSDHCTWEGVTCSAEHEVTELVLDDKNLSGAYPSDLNSFPRLASLSTLTNKLTGSVPDDLCVRSTGQQGLVIKGDSENCPNVFDTATGAYLEGCCDTVEVSTS